MYWYTLFSRAKCTECTSAKNNPLLHNMKNWKMKQIFFTVAINSSSRQTGKEWNVVLFLMKQVKIAEIIGQKGAPRELLPRSTGFSVNTGMRKFKQLCARYYFCCFFVHFTVIVAKLRTWVDWNGKLNSTVSAPPSAARFLFINPTVRFILMITENHVDLDRIVTELGDLSTHTRGSVLVFS